MDLKILVENLLTSCWKMRLCS